MLWWQGRLWLWWQDVDAGWLTAVVTGRLWRAFEFVGRGGCDFLARGGIPGMFWAMPFSFLSLEAFSADNALLFSGIRKIRYRRGPPTVRNMRAVRKTGSWGTRRIIGGIRCKKQAFPVRRRYSVPETPFSGTGHVSVNTLLMHGCSLFRGTLCKAGLPSLQSGCSGGFNRSCFLVLGARQWAASYPGRDSMYVMFEKIQLGSFYAVRILQGDLFPGRTVL